MSAPRVLLTGLGYGESPRWHDGRLWFANWGTGDIVAVDPGGASEVVAHVPTTIPYSFDWLPDGRLLVVCGQENRLLRQEYDGSLVTHVDLGVVGEGFNEIVVDGRGNVYVNGATVVHIDAEGKPRTVAGNIEFGNGMAVTPDNSTLIVAESFGRRLTAFDIADDGGLTNRRVWADLGDGYPDGICLDAEGAAWYGDVANTRCVRVREGGEVLQTIDLDRGCFACMLGGDDRRTLFMLAAHFRGMEHLGDPGRTGQLLAVDAPAPGAGRP
jgi:sugar lactone lactonase YvrE